MKCPECKTEIPKTTGKYQYRECGLDNVWLTNWPMFICSDCDISLPLLPKSADVARMISTGLVNQEASLDGDSIRFLRTAMSVTAVELAHILGVNRVEVSRWENNKCQINPFHDFKLRLEIIDRLLPVNKRRKAREEVTLIIQRAYKPETPISQIMIPAEPELQTVAG